MVDYLASGQWEIFHGFDFLMVSTMVYITTLHDQIQNIDVEFYPTLISDKCGTPYFFEKNYRRSWEDQRANENHLIDWKLKGNDRSKSRVKILLKTREKRLRHDSTMTSSSPEASKIVTRFFFSQMSSWILSLSLSLRQMSMSGFFLIRTLNLLNVLPPWILTDIIMIRITWI